MKIKTIYQATAALLAMFVLILFMMNGCSKDDSDPVPDPVITSWELPAGDFPSVTISKEGNQPVIGDPIKTITKKHKGDFSPKVNAYKGKDWHGIARYDHGAICGGTKDASWSIDEEQWSNQLPNKSFHIVFPTIFCTDQNFTLDTNKIGWTNTEANAKRWRIMEDGTWYNDYFSDWKTITDNIDRQTFFRQLTHPDLYITMERDYEILPGNDETFQGGRSYEVTTKNALGVKETQINTMGASLSVEVSASYGFVSGSINATVYGESTNALTIDKYNSKETKENWTVPVGEKWRNLTLTKVERYYFSDSEGNPWESDNLKIEEIGELTNYIGTNFYEIHYKDNNVIYWAGGSDQIESLK